MTLCAFCGILHGTLEMQGGLHRAVQCNGAHWPKVETYKQIARVDRSSTSMQSKRPNTKMFDGVVIYKDIYTLYIYMLLYTYIYIYVLCSVFELCCMPF